MNASSPSFSKLTLSIAAGIVLAVILLFVGSAIIAGIAESKSSTELKAEQRQAIDDCRARAMYGDPSYAEQLRLLLPCRELVNEYVAKWNEQP